MQEATSYFGVRTDKHQILNRNKFDKTKKKSIEKDSKVKIVLQKKN